MAYDPEFGPITRIKSPEELFEYGIGRGKAEAFYDSNRTPLFVAMNYHDFINMMDNIKRINTAILGDKDAKTIG